MSSSRVYSLPLGRQHDYCGRGLSGPSSSSYRQRSSQSWNGHSGTRSCENEYHPPRAVEFVELLRQQAELREDPTAVPKLRSADPGDDFLIALAKEAQAFIISGDRHLLDLEEALPVYRPAAFLAMISGDPQ